MMNHPHGRKKRKKGQQPEPPPPMPLKEKVKMWAWIIGMFGLVAAFFHVFETVEQNARTERTLERWRRDYHLTDEQCQRIRKMERDFHGGGDPFVAPSRSTEETDTHHRAIAAMMSPEDATRFLQSTKGSASPHQP